MFDPVKYAAGTFGKTLRSANYSHFYILPPSFSSAWMSFQSKIPQRIGYAGEFRSLLLSKAKKHEGKPRSVHILKEYLNLLDPQLSVEKFPPGRERKFPPGDERNFLRTLKKNSRLRRERRKRLRAFGPPKISSGPSARQNFLRVPSSRRPIKKTLPASAFGRPRATICGRRAGTPAGSVARAQKLW